MKEYYATLCEFYLKHDLDFFLGLRQNPRIQTPYEEQNGEQYEVFSEYQFIQYDLNFSLGEMSDDALRMFQARICQKEDDVSRYRQISVSDYYPFSLRQVSAPLTIVRSRIVCCSVEQKPQWDGNGTIQFPCKLAVQLPSTENSCEIDTNIAIWIREICPQSLEEQEAIEKKLSKGNGLLKFPPAYETNWFTSFCYNILKKCHGVASDIQLLDAKFRKSQTLPEKPEPVAATAAKGKKKTGSKGLTESEKNRRLEILENWKEASSRGISAKEFSTENKLKVGELDKIVNWNTKQQKRQKPR